MEKQNHPPPPSPNCQLKQLYDIRYRNYQWEDFKYQIPKKYTHFGTSFVKSGNLFCTKKSYLDSLVQHKKKIPAPNYYTNIQLKSRPQSGKMDRSKRMTISDQVYSQSQKNKIPGPGSYFKRPQSCFAYSNSSSQKQKIIIEKPHYLNQVEYLADTSPGVGLYNINISNHVSGPKIAKRISKQSQSQKSKDSSKLLNILQSCYGTFDWLQKQSKKKSKNNFGKSERFASLTNKSKQPAPNTYKFNHNWSTKTNSMNITSTINHHNVYYH